MKKLLRILIVFLALNAIVALVFIPCIYFTGSEKIDWCVPYLVGLVAGVIIWKLVDVVVENNKKRLN